VLERIFMLIVSTEASRAKHKFAVKRNSWPKTRGVAMNPVDHPHGVSNSFNKSHDTALTRNRVVTINILVKHRQSRDTLPKVKKPVSLLPGELVCYVVPKRSRIERVKGVFINSDLLGLHLCIFGWSSAGMTENTSTTISCALT
jgi:hypothetical protein